ncbi:PREDICTED: terminal uridylyltransferase 4 isoform X2 [Nanorana parkeri]|uniref:terminal uridylyltransferase 4 isoform X2 n=1 Tax=Nanorana parkeri TaxID=125878 RepID=UPI000854135F|nr:PREDICTED: terminal uridylyltransferase 4 isoform X2 [Nanorana parkeri]
MMDGVTKPVSHEPRKPVTRASRGEGRGTRVVNNQKHKHRGNGKLGRDGDVSSPTIVKKGKPTESANAPVVDSRTCKETSVNCTSGSVNAGQGHQDLCNTRAKKSSSPPAENFSQLRTIGSEQSCPQSKEAGEALESQNLIAQHQTSPESCPEEKKDVIHSDCHAEPSIDQETSPVTSSPPCKAAENSPCAEPAQADTTPTDESVLADQELGLKQAEERLERDYIHRLEKRSPDFSNCQYLCKLCSVHIENVQGAHKHIKEKRHKKNILEKQEENELRALPPPSAAQIAALGVTLANAAKEHGISQEDFLSRKEIVTEMEKIIQSKLPECSLRMYGSSLTRFAFQTSDINIDIKFPPKMSQPDVLIQVLEILKNSSPYVDVESDFHAKVPVVFCKDENSGLTCKVSAGNDTACLTTELLAAVGRLEPTLIALVLAFRYWAKLCHIDCQAEGGVPSYSFALMVVFFLQKRKPPILPTYLGSRIEGFESKRLDDYHLKGIYEEKYVEWEYRPASNDNKNSSGMDGRGRAEQNHRRAAASEAESRKNKEKMGKCRLVFGQPHQVSLGQLWLELLRFYTLEFAMEEYVISVRVHGLISRETKNWPKRRIAIEDPFALKRNVARSLNSQMVYEYILERFRAAYRYFACPQSKEMNKSRVDNDESTSQTLSQPGDQVANGSLPGGERAIDQDGGAAESRISELETEGCGVLGGLSDKVAEAVQRLRVDGDEAVRSTSALDSCELDILPFSETDQASALLGVKGSKNCNGQSSTSIKDLHDTTEVKCASEEVCSLDESCSDSCPSATSHCHMKNEGSLSEDELYYVFDKLILTSGKPPTIVCGICKRDGHSKDDCPEDFKKIDLKPLPPMNLRFREILDRVCKRCYDELSPSPAEQQNREQILIYLERFIRKEFNGNARLCLFGSSKNGFGFRDSDLDICMTLEGHENAEKLNCKEIIEGLAKVLKRHPGLKNILPITTAKVPIVKFEHRESCVEGDISLYNTLAQHNTRMLATYAAIDPRVKYLGYAVKFFAKRCDIGDASRGSLSSYAYILMVLYFLQQRNPPVIPVLQEIYDGHIIPRRMVDGWNAFFFDNMEELRGRFPSLGKNVESMGELWLGFLRFYTEEFDFKEYVISIRQKKLLTTFEKQWTSKCIAIEDPFDLNHNLGAGVSRKMTNFIMKAFINGRKLFGTPFYPLPGLEAEYFFDSKVLTDGELAPNDRCCRVCGKIGHYMKDCPKRRRIKKKENEKDDDKDIKEEERELREKRCFTCGDVGHVRRDCPENNNARQKNNILASQILSLIVPQQVLTPLQQLERPTRTRQASESSDSHHSSYSSQTQQFQQNSINQSQAQQIKLQQASQAPNAHQVQRPMFNFPHSPPTHFSPLHSLGLLPLPPQIPIHNNSWPMRGQIIRSSGNPPHSSGVTFPTRSGSGNTSTTNQSAVSLNDPSIIFAQPAARSVGVPTSSHDGHWHNSQTPTSLVSNGNVGSTEQGFQGQFAKPHPWERGAPSHYPLIPGSWPYNLPQNFLQQAPTGFHSKAYFPPAGSLIQNGPQFPVLSQGHPHLNSSYIQQKK